MADQAKRFQQLLRELARRGLTQAQVGQEIDLPAQVVSDIKRGRRPISYALAMKIQEVFGVSHEWLLQGQEPMFRGAGQDRPRMQAEMVFLPLLERISPGVPSDDSLWPLTMHPVPESQAAAKPGGTRYVLRVPDDGMAPVLRRGDLVLVENRPDIAPAQADHRICTVELPSGELLLREARRVTADGRACTELRSPGADGQVIRFADSGKAGVRIYGLVQALIWRLF